MEARLMVVIVMLMVQPWSPSFTEGGSSLFRRVQVSNATVRPRVKETCGGCSGLSSSFCCSRKCSALPWCQLWCHEPPSDECLLSNLFVMPTYVEANSADAISCFTRRHKDLATGAAIQAVPVYPNHPHKVKENLVDGVYDPDDDMWYRTDEPLDYPWILLDFGVPVSFSLVRVLLQEFGSITITQDFANMELRVGSTPVDTLGDFSSYILIDTFVGPPTAFGQEILFQFEPVTAQFLSLQKNGVGTRFQIAHIEVY